MTGVFAKYEPLYAEHRLPIFPCSSLAKRPLVSNYFKMGIPASTELARKFTDANALAFASGKRSRITVLDIDVADQRVLEDAIARHGEPRIVVRTASGKFHCYYRHNGERRRIRPWPDRKIDLLGHQGVVIAPPSQIGSGKYEIIVGSLDDLDRLTPMRGLDDLKPARPTEPQPVAAPAKPGKVKKGHRNNWLWRECMKQARQHNTLDALLDWARACNLGNSPPMEDQEVMTIAANAWTYTARGQNRFGQHGAWIPVEDAAAMVAYPDALALLVYLRANEGPWAQFMVLNTLAGKFGWTVKRLQKARLWLIETGHIKQIKPAFTGSPARYQWDD